jgi:hypothetical protein
MKDLLRGLPERARGRVVAAEQPSWVAPMLATLTGRRFSDPGWVFEPKFDGERCLAFRDGSQVRLLSRNRKRLDDRYPELVAALAAEADFVVDGEIVAFQGGRSSFARLQRRMQVRDPDQARRSRVAVHLYLFDVLHAAGHDLTGLELRQRKAVLRRLLAFHDPLRFTPHRNAGGQVDDLARAASSTASWSLASRVRTSAATSRANALGSWSPARASGSASRPSRRAAWAARRSRNGNSSSQAPGPPGRRCPRPPGPAP